VKFVLDQRLASADWFTHAFSNIDIEMPFRIHMLLFLWRYCMTALRRLIRLVLLLLFFSLLLPSDTMRR